MCCRFRSGFDWTFLETYSNILKEGLLRLLPFLIGGHRQLALENLALRQQLAVYRRTVPRPKLRTTDRLLWVGLARVWAGWRAGAGHRFARHCPAVAASSLP